MTTQSANRPTGATGEHAGQFDAAQADAFLLSTDTQTDQLRERCRAVFGPTRARHQFL
jgi:hypothetical protein